MKHVFFLQIALLFFYIANSQTVTDVDGNTYPTIKIGDQTWMKENLRVTKAPDGTPLQRYCYNDNASNCDKYGGLYTWDSAMSGSAPQGICPDGWQVPNTADWQKLVKNFSGGTAGRELKIGGSASFDALFGGSRNAGGVYSSEGQMASFWSSVSDAGDAKFAGYRFLNAKYDKFSRSRSNKAYAFSVRCIKK